MINAPAGQAQELPAEPGTSPLGDAFSCLAALGGLLLTVIGLAFDRTATTVAGIVLGVAGSLLVYVLSRTMRMPSGRLRRRAQRQSAFELGGTETG